MKPIPEDKDAFDSLMARNPKFPKAFALRCEGLTDKSIANHLNVTPRTIVNWWEKSTLPSRRKFHRKRPAEKPNLKKVKDRVANGEDAEDILNDFTHAATADLKTQAQEEEDKTLAAIAESQATAADKYQHYIAAAGIKLLRDSMKALKGPRTVRELSELDQMIRRNLGLNAKTGGGNGGKMQIDISILNNGLADRGNGTLAKMKKDTIDADLVDEKIDKTKKR